MSRPPVTYGIWPDMIMAAGSAHALAEEIGCSVAWLRRVSRAERSFRGPHLRLAVRFARAYGIPVRAYAHPSSPGAYIVSTAEGWWCVSPLAGAGDAWASRYPVRLLRHHLSSLSLLEVPFFRMWAACGSSEKGREIQKRHCAV